MKRTSTPLLLVLGVGGGALGYLVDSVLSSTGRATFLPSPLLIILLLLLAASVLALAWPIRASQRGGKRVDPFRAARVVTLARASSLLGAAVGGFCGGLLVFLHSRPILPPVGSTVTLTVLVLSALVLVGAALVAEGFCILPKGTDDISDSDDTATGDGRD